jgi:NitT/TauT family transport system ATP-binding protein
MFNTRLLEINDVYKEYGPKRVLGNIDLRVNAGELVTVVGPSGCGKSTLLRLILGQEQPTAGNISISGEPIGLPSKERGIVYQHYSLFPNLTVLENVQRYLTLKVNPLTAFLKKSQYAEQVKDILHTVRLYDAMHKYPHELSGGMRQRVAIAQALVAKPKILLMDEPFGALDTGTRTDLQAFLIELWQREKMTIFFVTHDLDEAIQLSSRMICLSQFYTDDRGITDRRGAKIVYDADMSHIPFSTDAIHRNEVRRIRDDIFDIGFDPTHLQHVRDFNLTHKDSYQTLTIEEDSSSHNISGE